MHLGILCFITSIISILTNIILQHNMLTFEEDMKKLKEYVFNSCIEEYATDPTPP